MTIISNRFSSTVVSNLDTYQLTVPDANIYKIACTATEIPPSGLQITVMQNSTQLLQTVVPASSQNHVEASVLANCAVNDVLQIILSSSSSADSLRNVIKAVIKFSPGQV